MAHIPLVFVFLIGATAVTSLFQHPTGKVVKCLTCSYLDSPMECEHSHQCNPGETCFLGEVDENNSTFYVQYCYPEPGCKYMKQLVENGQRNLRGYLFNWISCCNSDNCNRSKTGITFEIHN